MDEKKIFNYEALLEHVGGSDEFACELLEESIKLLPGYLKDIMDTVHSGDITQTKKNAHRLKGGMRTIHAQQLAGIADSIEQAASIHDMIKIKSLLIELEETAELTIAAIQEKIQK